MSLCIAGKSRLIGEVIIPTSKSHTLRAILFASLAKGKSTIRNYLHSSDATAMIEACRLLGVSITYHGKDLEIVGLDGKVGFAEDVINAGNSGIVLRFIASIAALSTYPIVITGDESIRSRRPLLPLLSALDELGAKAISTKKDGYAPVIITGPIRPGKVTISGEDSQPVSALLIASAFLKGKTEVNVINAGEKPWIAMTLSWFDRLGIRYENDNFSHYRIFGRSHIEGFDYTVPSDLSSAAFPIVAALITSSSIQLKNIDMEDAQGDKELIYVLQKMGAKIEIDTTKNTLTIEGGSELHALDIDVNPFIDAVPILAVVACFANGQTTISNAAIARQKESDRLSAITIELKKMGADITELPDGLIIRTSKLKGANLSSHKDHRIAMSLLVASFAVEETSTIDGFKCVEKTFPDVVEKFQSLGANISVLP